jgi:hypothetical protein
LTAVTSVSPLSSRWKAICSSASTITARYGPSVSQPGLVPVPGPRMTDSAWRSPETISNSQVHEPAVQVDTFSPIGPMTSSVISTGVPSGSWPV